jgi:hypothetical protein
MKKLNMTKLKPVSTPKSMATVLDLDENDEPVDQREYRSMIRSLLYLTTIRPDIQFVVCMCARFQASPRSSYQTFIQWVFKYHKYTLKFEIWYSTSSSLDLAGFFDTDFAGCGIDQKNSFGTCHFLRSSLICWSARK